MDFELTDRCQAAARAPARVHGRARVPGRAGVPRAARRVRRPALPSAGDGGAQGARPRAGAVEPVPPTTPEPSAPGPDATSSTRRWPRSWAAATSRSEACNCAAPDTGNMEVLTLFGTPEQKDRWLAPLLEGEIRSAFAMTEPAVASSDATNIELRIERDGDEYVLNGRKWWTSGALRERCQDHDRDGQDRPGRPRLPPAVDDPGPARHARASRSCGTSRCSATSTRRATREIAVRGRAGPGREPDRQRGRRLPDLPGAARARTHPPLHALDRRGRAGARADVRARGLARARSASRWPSAPTSRTGSPSRGSRSRWSRLLTLKAAWLMDTVGNKHARTEIAAIKVAAPNVALQVIDRAIQVHGGGGVSDDFPLADDVRPPAHAAAGRRARRDPQADDRPPRAPPARDAAACGSVTAARTAAALPSEDRPRAFSATPAAGRG